MKLPCFFARGLLALGLLSASLVSAQVNLPGEYTVTGKDFAGQAFTGKLSIVQRQAVYRMTYRDGRTQRGMGIQRGNALFAAWGPNISCTVSALEIGADGNMSGPWGDLDQNILGTENLKRQSGAPSDVVGTFESSGKTPTGESYSGVTTIERRGAVFKVTFRGDGDVQEGVGVRLGNYLSVSYGGKNCGVTAYDIKADGSLVGVFAAFGESRVGSEEMRKGW